MTDELTRHQIYLQRYAGGILKEMSPELKALRDDVANRILTATEYESARLSLLMADLNKIIDGHFQPLTNTIFKNVDELAAYEQQYALSLLDDATIGSVVIGAGANVSLLQAYVKNDPIRMIGEAPQTIGSMIDTFNSAYKRDINTIVSTGILEGKTTKEMARAVTSLSNTRSRRQAEALVRTIVNHTGSSSRKRTFADNRELFIGELFVATLDGRTSLTCATRDGGIWDYNGAPLNGIARGSTFARPPLHYNCRSLLVDELKDEYKIIKEDTRASEGGQVSADTTYGDWLKRQPKAVQDKVLGKTRAELFRDGKVTLDKFTDKTGEVYTLKELAEADSII
jgi:hypothetical protein